MKFAAAIAIVLLLAGCGVVDVGKGPDIHAIKDCANKHPPPPQANVENLGLLPVYLTRTADSNDAETKKWFADMDACVGQYKPPAGSP